MNMLCLFEILTCAADYKTWRINLRIVEASFALGRVNENNAVLNGAYQNGR